MVRSLTFLNEDPHSLRNECRAQDLWLSMQRMQSLGSVVVTAMNAESKTPAASAADCLVLAFVFALRLD